MEVGKNNPLSIALGVALGVDCATCILISSINYIYCHLIGKEIDALLLQFAIAIFAHDGILRRF